MDEFVVRLALVMFLAFVLCYAGMSWGLPLDMPLSERLAIATYLAGIVSLLAGIVWISSNNPYT